MLVLAAAGCNIGKFEAPPVPEGYPALEEFDDGKAELTIDGENFVSEYDGSTDYNPEGGFDDQLRASLSFGASGSSSLYLDFREIDIDSYTIEDGDLTAAYHPYQADPMCGRGNLEIVGRRRWSPFLGTESEVMWGSIQLELCDTNEESVAQIEISGRFSSVISVR